MSGWSLANVSSDTPGSGFGVCGGVSIGPMSARLGFGGIFSTIKFMAGEML